MQDILTTEQVKKILETEPEAEFSLQRVKVNFEGGGYMIAGYHIFRGTLEGMIHRKGREIWENVKEPQMLVGICIKLLYSSFLACYINTADMKECGPEVKDFRPIYVMYHCNQCSNDVVFKEMLFSGEKECK